MAREDAEGRSFEDASAEAKLLASERARIARAERPDREGERRAEMRMEDYGGGFM